MTVPVGLFGLAMKIARVRDVTAASRSPTRGLNPSSADAAIRTRAAPEAAMVAS